MRRPTLSAVLGLILATASSASAATWQIDPAHSSVQFAVRHLMVSTVRGTFNTVSGTVTTDDADPTKKSACWGQVPGLRIADWCGGQSAIY